MKPTLYLNELRKSGYFDVAWLKHFAKDFYPTDSDLARWTWMLLLDTLPSYRLLQDEQIVVNDPVASKCGTFQYPNQQVLKLSDLHEMHTTLCIHTGEHCHCREDYKHAIDRMPQYEGGRSLHMCSHSTLSDKGWNACTVTFMRHVILLLPSR